MTELQTLADIIGRITDDLNIAGMCLMGDLPKDTAGRWHALTDQAWQLKWEIGKLAVETR